MATPRRKRRTPRPTKPPRSILPDDRRKIVHELNLICRPAEGWKGTESDGERGRPSISALRLRAIVLLAAGGALRLGELCNLNLIQVLDDTTLGSGRWRLRSLVYLRPEQSKGRRVGPEQWDSAGTIAINDDARSALRAYIHEVKRRKWVEWPPKPDTPLFVAVRGNGRHAASAAHNTHARLSVRTLQWQWGTFQTRAGIVPAYRFHDLRHTAMTKCAEVTNGNVKLIADFGRCDVQTAMRYVHLTPGQLGSIRNACAFR